MCCSRCYPAIRLQSVSNQEQTGSNRVATPGGGEVLHVSQLQVAERLHVSQCLVFCRTNLDCDNLEKFLNMKGGGAFRGKAEKVGDRLFVVVSLYGVISVN